MTKPYIVRRYDRSRLRKVAEWIRRQTEEVTTAEVAMRHGVTRNNAAQILTRLHLRGDVVRIQLGVYRRAS